MTNALPWITLGLSIVLLLIVGFVAYRLHRDVKEWEHPESRLESKWIADRVAKGQGFEE